MEFKASQIAEILKGSVEGNPDEMVWTLSKIEEGHAGSLTFLANPKYTPFIYTTEASVVIVNQDFIPEKSVKPTLIKVEDAYMAFTQLLQFVEQYKKQNKEGIEQPSYIATTAQLGENIYVGAFAYIGENVTIGDNVKIYPHTYIGDNSVVQSGTILYAGVKIYPETLIGHNCTLHAGAVIGADGFGFAPNANNEYCKIPQIGNVVLEDNVEIGANTTIDRATLGSTIIHKGTKLDNLIQVAHNVEIGEDSVIASQTGIAGSTKVGKRAMIGGQVGLSGHIKLGDDVRIAAQSGIGNNLNDEAVVQGSPAFEVGAYKRAYVLFRQLPNIIKRINALEKNSEK